MDAWIGLSVAGGGDDPGPAGAAGRREVRPDGPGAAGAPGGEGEAGRPQAPPAHRRVHPHHRGRERHLLHPPGEASGYVRLDHPRFALVLCLRAIKLACIALAAIQRVSKRSTSFLIEI